MISKNNRIQALEIFTQNRFPREFGRKGKRKFMRNLIVGNIEELYEYTKTFEFRDCFVSVFSFREIGNDGVWRRETVIIDNITFDIDSNDLQTSFLETRRVLNFFKRNGIDPYVQFSGKKGFHIRIFFEPVKLNDPVVALKRVVTKISEAIKLSCVDFTVSSDIARLIRIPLTYHSETSYLCAPLDPEIFKYDLNTILHFVKQQRVFIKDIEKSDEIRSLLKKEDLKAQIFQEYMKIFRKGLKKNENTSKKGGWRRKLIEKYARVLKNFGRLTVDEEIRNRHNGNEHKARLFLNLLMIEEGYEDDEIKEVLSFATDYKPEITEYQIKYNRKWYERKLNEPLRNL